MHNTVQQYINESHEQAGQHSANKKMLEIAVNMIRQKLDLKLIAQVTGFGTDELLKIKANQ